MSRRSSRCAAEGRLTSARQGMAMPVVRPHGSSCTQATSMPAASQSSSRGVGGGACRKVASGACAANEDAAGIDPQRRCRAPSRTAATTSSAVSERSRRRRRVVVDAHDDCAGRMTQLPGNPVGLGYVEVTRAKRSAVHPNEAGRVRISRWRLVDAYGHVAVGAGGRVGPDVDHRRRGRRLDAYMNSSSRARVAGSARPSSKEVILQQIESRGDRVVNRHGSCLFRVEAVSIVMVERRPQPRCQSIAPASSALAVTAGDRFTTRASL